MFFYCDFWEGTLHLVITFGKELGCLYGCDWFSVGLNIGHLGFVILCEIMWLQVCGLWVMCARQCGLRVIEIE